MVWCTLEDQLRCTGGWRTEMCHQDLLSLVKRESTSTAASWSYTTWGTVILASTHAVIKSPAIIRCPHMFLLKVRLRILFFIIIFYHRPRDCSKIFP